MFQIFWNMPDHIKLVDRATPLEPKRVMSVFKERVEKHKEELEEIGKSMHTELNSLPNLIALAHLGYVKVLNTVSFVFPESMIKTVDEEVPPNVVWQEKTREAQSQPGTQNFVYYEQFTIPGPITMRRGRLLDQFY